MREIVNGSTFFTSMMIDVHLRCDYEAVLSSYVNGEPAKALLYVHIRINSNAVASSSDLLERSSGAGGSVTRCSVQGGVRRKENEWIGQ